MQPKKTTVVKWDTIMHGSPSVVFIGRPGPWANMFRIGEHGGRKQVVESYRQWAMAPQQRAFRNRVRCELRGKELACYCHPLPCHGDVLAAIADSPIE